MKANFDARPAALIRELDLRRPIYRKTAAYGHFGRTDAEFTWERTDKAARLKEGAKSPAAASGKSGRGKGANGHASKAPAKRKSARTAAEA